LSESASAVKLALQARRVRTATPDVELLQSEPIAVVGIGCRMPGGEGPEGFWRMLVQGVDAIREVPPERWDVDAYYDPDPSVPGKMVTRWGSFLPAVDGFDAAFFGIAPREAATMDPQHRLLLEVAYETLEDAGEDADRLAGTATGVFLAVYNSDYARQQLAVLESIDAYTSSGTAHSIASGRISFVFDFRGPSVTIDTACSSSLAAVHVACQSLRAGDSDLALAGGASLILGPEPAVSMSKWGMMSRDGRCKAFDARADGFVRGEGCGIVALKRLSDALAAGDRVRAVIRGTAVNQDGRSANLTAPNGLAQQQVVRQALANARVAPEEVGYIEAHGTGTTLGDPIEVEALTEVLGRGGPGSRPCALASVKTNIGHLEAAAGIAGLIKTALALEHGLIPPHLHFQAPNPHISFEGTRFYVPTESRPWTAGAGPRFAGVSSFGFGGTNAHVVLEDAPRLPERAPAPEPKRAEILPLSAQGLPALAALAGRYAAFLSQLGPDGPFLTDICRSAATRRTHLDHRLVVVGDAPSTLASKLEAYARGERPAGLTIGVRSRGRQPKVAFVFSGQGPQWWGMGRQLEAAEPVFRESLARTDAEIRRHASWSLREELHADEATSRLSRTEIAQPALFALQLALAELWRSWGIEPHGVVGHSVGEVAAAHVAGAFDFATAVRLVVLRGRVMQKATGLGKMASVELPAAEVEELLEGRRDSLAVAAVNGPRSTVVSGAREPLELLLAGLTERRVAWRMLPVDYAFHSPQMAPLGEELTASLTDLETSEPSLLLVSATLGRRVAGAELLASYWGRNMRCAVLFAAATEGLLEAGCDAFLEIGPHPVLSHAVLSTAEERGADVPALASLRRGQDERATMLAALGALYTRGSTVRWDALHSEAGRLVTLPSYPWQHERYWFDRAGRAPAGPASSRVPARATGQPLLGARLRSTLTQAQFDAEWNVSTLPFVQEHRILGTPIVPATGFAAALLAAAADLWGTGAHVLQDLQIEQPLPLGPGASRVVQIVVEDPAGDATRAWISSLSEEGDGEQWTRHATAQLRRAAPGEERIAVPSPPDEAGRSRFTQAAGSLLYDRLREGGIELGPAFQRVEEILWDKGEALARLRAEGPADREEPGEGWPPAVLDACLQPIAAAFQDLSSAPAALLLPIGVTRLRLLAPPEASLWTRVSLRPPFDERAEAVTADAFVFNSSGSRVAEIEGVQLKRTDRDAFVRGIAPLRRDALHEVSWRAVRPAPGAPAAGSWLIIADRGGLAERLATALEALGHRSVVAVAGGRFRRLGSERYEIDLLKPEDFAELLGELRRGSGTPGGAVLLSALDERVDDMAAVDAVRDSERRVCGTALYLTQALAALGAPAVPRLSFVTRGVHAIGAEAGGTGFAQAPLWGLRSVIALEHAELRARCIDLDPVPYVGEVDGLAAELADQGDEMQVALRAGTRYVARLVKTRLQPGPRRKGAAEPRRLECSTPGELDRLKLRPAPRSAPGPGQVEVQVRAAGLNFRDVLKALGMYPGEAGLLGDECAGLVTAVGPGVTRFTVGDEVFGVAPGAFATFTLASEALLLPKPRELTFAEAASIPSVFGTARYALDQIARLKAGDRVLIQAAAGGVGLAAARLALAVGAEVFATAGSPEKRDFLDQEGVAHVMDSRSLDFADEVLRLTGGRGVDVVLNSLAGEFIPRGLAVVRRGGCFLELGRIGAWTEAQVAALGRDLRYHPIFFADVCAQDPGLVRSLVEGVCDLLADGRLALPPVRCFALDDAVSAFRFMAQARHVGKLVLTSEPSHPAEGAPVRETASYLVTGGLGGLGLEVARALVQSGARHLVLAGRAEPTEAAAKTVDELRQAGSAVRLARFDVANQEETRKALAELSTTGPPLRGIVHAAGVLDDGLLVDQEVSRFERVLEGKAVGAFNLHQATLGTALDFFVCFSSAASILGGPGQGSYAAANAFVDAFARYRRGRGLAALSINWGPWTEVGMAARLAGRDRSRMQERGFSALRPAEGTRLFLELLRTDLAQVAAVPGDWSRFAQNAPPGAAGVFVEELVRGQAASVPARAMEDGLPARLQAAPPGRRRALLVEALHDLATTVLGLEAAASIDPVRPLKEMGLDSLMAVELRNALSAKVGRRLPATLLFDHPTLDALAAHLLGLLELPEAVAAPAATDGAVEDRAAEVRDLTDEEAEALLVKELGALGPGDGHA
jgi:acyl transferase domain-containing protein/NADP-dependent 3-hydroxy acid dehydrogenase YdfG